MVDLDSIRSAEDPALAAGHPDPPPRMGFFTDTSVCIGCKACEVACKEWNGVPARDSMDLLGMSMDNTGALTANSWRHVAFVEQSGPRPAGGTGSPVPAGAAPDARAGGPRFVGMPGSGPPGRATGAALAAAGAVQPPGGTGTGADRDGFRWLMMSDVCKHCTHAACLDVCPTGSLFRTEFGTVVVQEDICNGCGYCIPACPFGVIDQRRDDGRAWKCTLCYDRIGAGMTPACAQACPTESIQYGPVEELRERAAARVAALHADGVGDATLYGQDPTDGIGGAGAFFLLLDAPEVYGLPPDPVVTTRALPRMWRRAGLAAVAMAAATVVAFVGGRR